MMGPCGTAYSSIKTVKKGMGVHSVMFKHNFFKQIHRKYPSANKENTLTLKSNQKIRNQASKLSQKINKTSLTWSNFVWAFLFCLCFIAFFCEYCFIVLDFILVFVIIKVVYDAYKLNLYFRKVVPERMRKIKISKAKKSVISQSNPGDYYVI